MLDAVNATVGVGIDTNKDYIAQAQLTYSHFQFFHGDIKDVTITYQFDYIVLSFATMEAMISKRYCSNCILFVIQAHVYW